MPRPVPSSRGAFAARLVRHPVSWLVLFQIAMTVIVSPRGNFPTNDDWAYSHSVTWLFDEHRIRLSNWIAMNLLPQTLMGGAVSALFGFSHTALRVLTELVALATSVLAFRFFRTAGMNGRDALVAACIVVASPWWLSVANSYMSDLYCMLFALPAASAYLRYLETPQRPRTLWLAAALTAVAVLERQVALVLPFAFLAAAVFRTRERRPLRLLAFASPLVAALAVEALYQRYLVLGPGLPEAQQMLHGRLLPMALRLVTLDADQLRWFAMNVRDLAGYLALVCASWGLWLGLGCERRKNAALFAGLVLALAAAALLFGWLPPYRPNNLIDAAGLGPFTVGNGLAPDAAGLDRDNPVFWRLAAAVAAVGLGALLVGVLRTPRTLVAEFRERSGATAFLAVLLACYFLPFAITDFIDRYVLFALPFALAWLHRMRRGSPPPALRRLAVALLAIVALVGALAAHDYFAWNRARWKAVEIAERRYGATPADLDAGFEYNGLHNHADWRGDTTGRHWWWVYDDRYLVDFAPPTNYEVLASLKVHRYLPSTPKRVLLLRRVSP